VAWDESLSPPLAALTRRVLRPRPKTQIWLDGHKKSKGRKRHLLVDTLG
jgi:hypothetical protein